MISSNMMNTTKRGASVTFGLFGTAQTHDMTFLKGIEACCTLRLLEDSFCWHALGRKDKVCAYHQDHYFSFYDPILRDLGYFPGPAMWHSAPESVSNALRDAHGERAILCGGPNRNNDYGAKEAGCASLNDLRMDQQAWTMRASGLPSQLIRTIRGGGAPA